MELININYCLNNLHDCHRNLNILCNVQCAPTCSFDGTVSHYSQDISYHYSFITNNIDSVGPTKCSTLCTGFSYSILMCSDLSELCIRSTLFVFCFQLFYSFFKSLVGKDVVVELKNDLRFVFNVENRIHHFAVLCLAHYCTGLTGNALADCFCHVSKEVRNFVHSA